MQLIDDVTTIATGTSSPFAYIEIRSEDGAVIATSQADSIGHWRVALPGSVHSVEVWSREATLVNPGSKMPGAQAASAGERVVGNELSISCFELEELSGFGELPGKGIGGHTTAEPGQKITATVGARRLGTVASDDGSWVIPFSDTVQDELGAGTHLVSVTVTDQRGNEAIVWDEVAVT